MKDIKIIEVFSDKIYIEYMDFESEYCSYTKAKKLIKDSKQELIRYTTVDNERAVDFINNMPKRGIFYDKYENSYLRSI